MADIVWKTTLCADAIAGVPYETSLAETGSATAITNCVVASGSLPPGLSISADFLRITGTPLSTGIGSTYTFTLTMTDTAGGVTSGSLTIFVRSAATGSGVDRLFGSLPAKAQIASTWPGMYAGI